ncbi:E3 ubiquitin-protein ligase TRIM39-like isoform X2 [Tachysurus fulvidraco]|uniref:E3 ubiquitin-protein ligase TRIM39-like isoform X2 n=1 Tax=Tachysurus fulvidraco TaxID=1234273 RepID=UPI001FEFBC9F|nr:E3 ubiquitin-protein ligase TRIM39-like isoform X2 [Tachysurus fulvidraco]
MTDFTSRSPPCTSKQNAPESIMQYLKCSICMDVLKEPVTTNCGHTFCKPCLNRHMSTNNRVCPLCKSQLPELKVNIVLKEILKEIQKPMARSPDEFTGQPGEVPCDVCNEDLKHKAVKSCLLCLLSFCKIHLKGHTKLHAKGHKLVAPMNDLNQWACLVHCMPLELYLVSEGKLICSRCVQGGTNVVYVEEESDRKKAELETLINRIEQGRQQRMENAKKLDNSASNCLSYPSTTAVDDGSNWTSDSLDTDLSFGTIRSSMVTMMDDIKDEFEKLSRIEISRIKKFGVNVTLDTDTANKQLQISYDMRQVRSSEEERDAPDCPERFNTFGSVLGQNRLTDCRAFWVVKVGNKQGWDIGVAREEANRKGLLSIKPSKGYWVIVHYDGNSYIALEDTPIVLSLSNIPCKVGVFVDYSEKLVSFYNMEAETHIYSFTDCAFGEVIRPYFSPHIKQEEPLVICPVNTKNNIPI